MPVTMTNTAASAGMPPICSLTAMAIGLVTDLGASVRSMVASNPSAAPRATALPAAVTEPARSATATALACAATRRRW